jgi:hypothetical protein
MVKMALKLPEVILNSIRGSYTFGYTLFKKGGEKFIINSLKTPREFAAENLEICDVRFVYNCP